MPTRLRRLLPALARALLGVAVAVVPVAAATMRAPQAAVRTTVVEIELAPRAAARRAVEAPSIGERAARIALEAVGVRYRWGGDSPSSGFDCSGLVRWAYGRAGVDLPHSSYALYAEGRRVARARMKSGDVLFFEGLGHVGLYLGQGRMVHAPQSGRRVEVVRLARSNYGRRLVGARRVAPA